jgi:hypothetical protein
MKTTANLLGSRLDDTRRVPVSRSYSAAGPPPGGTTIGFDARTANGQKSLRAGKPRAPNSKKGPVATLGSRRGGHDRA